VRVLVVFVSTAVPPPAHLLRSEGLAAARIPAAHDWDLI
jgi:hypothetical protein